MYTTRKPRPKVDWEEFDYWCDQVAAQTNITIHEHEDEAQPTGLLDSNGNELYRTKDRFPMGFRVR